MKTLVYEIEDPHVIELFFGKNPRYKSLRDIAREDCELIWEKDTVLWVHCGEIISVDVLGDDAQGKPVQEEFVVVERVQDLDNEEMIVIVHPRYSGDVEDPS